MRRRDTLRLIPLAAAGIPALASAQKKGPGPGMPARFRNKAGGKDPDPMTYVRRVIEMLRWVKAHESGDILESAYAIARTIVHGGKVWSCWDLGHTNEADLFPGRVGTPEILTAGYDAEKVKDGDLVLANFPWPAGYIEDLRSKDLFVVGGPCPWGGDVKGYEYIVPNIRDMKIRPVADIWIETNCDMIGAQVPIPGSDAPLGPESGPLNGTILWMMVADACRELSRTGKKFEVRGTGETLGKDTTWENLDAPLMDTYFSTVLHQLEQIGSEMGQINEMAGMAVDTLLGGGNVYFYSRYFPALAGEAAGRRGGFLFAKGVADGRLQGKSGDCVIMGTYEPDDERDLANLDDFKSRGMRIASIGPVSRDYKLPEGRAVYKETEAHAGRMCDTNGLFAIPGFNKKICPTSGIMATSILWVMSTVLALEVKRRTGGNVPGIHFNGALTWSADHNARMGVLARERGY